MNRLLEVGFEPAGHWLLQDGKLRFELLRHSTQKNVLYAFVCDGQVKYVGKTTQPLKVRMGGYKTPGATQTTNVNNHRRIRQLLQDDVAVEIFALPDNGLLHYGPFHLNLAAALEDDIIRVIDPEWNGGLPELVPVPVDEALVPDWNGTPGNEIAPATGLESFTFVLQPTYFQRGFFNVGVGAQHLLGSDGETVELLLGSRTEPILGTINRRANTNSTPRVLGGVGLRDWFAASARVSDTITVEVMSQTAVMLRVLAE